MADAAGGPACGSRGGFRGGFGHGGRSGRGREEEGSKKTKNGSQRPKRDDLSKV